MSSTFMEATVSSAQASISVVLVLGYGWLARRSSLISSEGESVSPFSSPLRSAQDDLVNVLLGGPTLMRSLSIVGRAQNISKLGTTVLLPCLLFSEIGPLATLNNLRNCQLFTHLPLGMSGISEH